MPNYVLIKKRISPVLAVLILATLIVPFHMGLNQLQAADALDTTAWPMFHHDLQHTGRSPYSGPSSPELKWSYTMGNYVSSSPAIDSDGTIYVGSADTNLYALNPNGSLKWSYATGGSVFSSPALGPDGTIYIGSAESNTLYALNQNGTLKWSYTTGGYIFSSPTIGTDGTIYIGSVDRKVYALNPDGTLKWSYTTGDSVYSSPAISSDGTIYVGSYDSKLYALNPDGTLKWSYTTGANVYSSPAIGSNGTIYIGSFDNKLYALNPNGTLKWSYATEGVVYCSPAIGSDGTIYIGSFDSYIYALNPNGTLQWSYATGSHAYSSLALGSDGTIYVGSWDNNKLHALNPDGTLKWSYSTGANVYSSPAIGSNGTIYIGSYDNKLYAIGSSQSPLANAVDALVSGGHGSVSPATQTVDYSANASIDITSDIGYHIATITDNGNPVAIANPYIIVGVTTDHNVVVTFAIDTFTITAGAGANGSITPSGEVAVNYGDTQTFTIAPDTGYQISNVLADGISVGAVASYTFDAVSTDHNISATFELTYDSLSNLVDQLVTNQGIANSLLSKLDAAKGAGAKGNIKAKAGAIGAFINQVQAQTGKTISAEDAAILIALAKAI